MHIEILRNSDKQSLQFRYIQYSGSSAAQVHGVGSALEDCVNLFGDVGGAGDVGAEAIDVAPENYAGEHVRGEVAVAAFAAAERDGDVEAERHWSYYPICRSAHLNWFEVIRIRGGLKPRKRTAHLITLAAASFARGCKLCCT